MKLMINVRILAIAIGLFGHLAQAQICQLTPFEAQAASSISMLQTDPIWHDFPTRYLFAVREFESTTHGFYVVTPNTRATLVQKRLASTCAEASLVQASEALMRVQGRFYPSCSASVLEDACLEIPQFLNVFKALGKPVGIVGIERAHLEKIKNVIGDIPYSFTQISVYHAIHEMFHEYQTEQKLQTGGSLVSIASCVENDPRWVVSFEKEKRWWAERFHRIHKSSNDPKTLKVMLNEYFSSVRPKTSDYQNCDEALARYQFHEGVAHFVGSLALQQAKLADSGQLAAIDMAYLKVPFETHNVMWVYATGGGLSWLLYYLMGDEFIAEIEKSKTPYEIGLTYLSSKK